MEFTFSIREALRRAWNIFWKNSWVFLVLTLISLVLSMSGRVASWIGLLGGIAAILWKYVSESISLAAVDTKPVSFSKETFLKAFPNVIDFLSVIGISISIFILIGIPFGIVAVIFFMIIHGVAVMLPVILLLLAAAYVMCRLSFSMLSYIDRKEGIFAAIRHSWNMTKGKVLWTILLTYIVCLGVGILGLIALVIGLLVAIPVVMIVKAQLYRTISQRTGVTKEEVGVEIIETVEIIEIIDNEA